MWTKLDSFFLCVFVAILFTPQCLVDARIESVATKNTQLNSRSVVERDVPKTPVSSQCACVSARNDYYYRYPEVAMANLDPVYHYQNSNSTYVWGNCTLCNLQPVYLSSNQCSICQAAMDRYQADYGVTSDQFNDYLAKVNTTGNSWHCELCIVSNTLACVAARQQYSKNNLDIGIMDPLFHYITYGIALNRIWPSALCSGGSAHYPTEFGYNCTTAVTLYTLYHNISEWDITDPMGHYLKYHRTIGWNWGFILCPTPTPYNLQNLDCVAAKLLYWINYPDVYALNIDPAYHYSNYAPAEPSRIWPSFMCDPSLDPVSFSDTKCAKCAPAQSLYIKTYPDVYDTSWGPDNPYSHWYYNRNRTWHCELCDNVFSTATKAIAPIHLVPAATCLGARAAYSTRYSDIAGVDPVFHFDTIGFGEGRFWDMTSCQSNFYPNYIDIPAAQCTAANNAYIQKHPDAFYYNTTFTHYKAFYLKVNSPARSLVWPYNLCGVTINGTAPTTPPTTYSTPVPTSTTSTSTVAASTSASSTAAVASTAAASTSATSTAAATSGATTTSATSGTTATSQQSSTTGASPTTSTTVSNVEEGSGAAEGLSTTAVLAIVVPVAAVLSVGLGMLFIHQQRRQAVQALIKAEEGERRNYKIDLLALSIDWLIGSGSFGHVYRGEYRGADVAIKKLKKQNMGNQQLEDFAKEAMVMVGLRHPNIVLFMGVCLEPPDLCIVTEYMPRGSLYDVLHDPTIKLPFNVIRSMALHVVKGLQFIHSAGMIHRDLKSPNLLVDSNWTIKIADFGLSCAKSQITEDAQISLLWTAPEILMREKNCYSEKSDVYSLGVILWEMMSRQTPFSEYAAAAIPPVIVLGKRPPIHNDWNGTFKVMMAHCWDQNPSHRPLVREVRGTLEGISQDSSYSDGGINTPASIYSSVSSSMSGNGNNNHAHSNDIEMNDYAPRGSVTLVFMDVDNSTQLWEADPRLMMTSLKLHNDIIRRLIHEYNGYEAKTEGDAFMLAFSDPINALNFCIASQLALLQVKWPDQLLTHPAAKEEWNDQGVLLYRGLRVRMGVHYGDPKPHLDRVSSKTEYVGPVVNASVAIATHAVGGQILMSGDVYGRATTAVATRVDPCVVEPLGSCSVKGLHDPIVLYQVWAKDLKGRSSQPVLDLTANNNSAGNSDPNVSSRSSLGSDAEYVWDLRNHEKWIINFEDLDLREVIGNGSFGDVFAGTWKQQEVAVKQFMKQKVTDEILLEMRTESGILSQIEHPNIIKFLGMCIKIPHLCIVTELLERGSLSTLLLGNESISWPQRKSFAVGVARGLEYLHKNNIIHRDVKSPNMLVSADWTIKIADFGFSRVKSETNTMTQCGTVAWTAPEIFLGDRYSEKADVYSYSVILWELVFRKKPWQGMNSMKVCHAVESGERLPVLNPPSGTPEWIMKLMAACWLQEHERRPSFTEVLSYLEAQP